MLNHAVSPEKLFKFVLPVISERGNHLNVSQQLILLTCFRSKWPLYCKYSIVQK